MWLPSWMHSTKPSLDLYMIYEDYKGNRSYGLRVIVLFIVFFVVFAVEAVLRVELHLEVLVALYHLELELTAYLLVWSLHVPRIIKIDLDIDLLLNLRWIWRIGVQGHYGHLVWEITKNPIWKGSSIVTRTFHRPVQLLHRLLLEFNHLLLLLPLLMLIFAGSS